MASLVDVRMQADYNFVVMRSAFMLHLQPEPYGGAYVVHMVGDGEVSFWGWVYTRSRRALRSVLIRVTFIGKTKNRIHIPSRLS